MDTVAERIILCGGGDGSARTSCLEFLPTTSTGSWVYYATLAAGRFGHTSHVFKGEVLILAGHVSRTSTEMLGKGLQYSITSTR
jgi:hypothetical protein